MAMAMAITEEEEVSLKVVVNKETNKVLFAEAKKDFVDVLFSFLTVPLATIVRLVENESTMGPVTIGSLNSFYHSVAALDFNGLWGQIFKPALLRPQNKAQEFCNSLKINIDNTHPPITFCPELVILRRLEDGFVNDAETFVITDDLMVIPNTVDYSVLAQMQALGIKGPTSLKEITMNFTKKKVLPLHLISLQNSYNLSLALIFLPIFDYQHFV